MKLLDFGLAKFVDVIAAQDSSSGLRVDKKEDAPQQDPLAATLDIGVIGPGGLPTAAQSPSAGSGALGMSQELLPGMEIRTPPEGMAELPSSVTRKDDPDSEVMGPVRVSYRQLLRETPPYGRATPQATSVAAAFAANTVTDAAADRRSDSERDSVGETSTIKGTPLYMAPEVFAGEPASRRSDVYSMGALLYELCVGQPPHFHPSLHELHKLVTGTDARPLASVDPAIDARFAAVVDRCLRRHPSERYASGDELREALELISAPARHEQIPEGNPYRGLLPFEAQHRSLFFGRKSEIGTLIERLRTETFVLVAADSGVGKSSVCRAGVIPLVQEGALAPQRRWLTASLVPGRRPLNALCSALGTALDCDEQLLLSTLRTEVQGFPRLLRKLVGDLRGLLLFVDQLEELVTIGDAQQSALVAEALSGIAAAGGDSLRLLATVRSDFLARVATLPSLGDDINRAVYLLRPMGPDKLREAVIGPAQLKGVSFESGEVIDELVESTAHTDGGLPLLQFALAELWDVRAESRITRAALQSIGGVAGALARHADHVISALPPEPRISARRILMALVTLEGTRARRTEDELVHSDPSAKAALDALVRGRLLVARDTPEGPAYEVAHEALIKGWDSLRKWLDEHQEARAVKQRLETAAAEWQRLGRSKEALWGARQLTEIALLEAADIGPRERSFIEASQRRESRLRQIRRVLLISIPILLGVLYGGVQLAARRNLERKIGSLREQGSQLLAAAQKLGTQVEQLRQESFASFDNKERDKGEALWLKVRELEVQNDRKFAQAANTLESALALDSRRDDIRELLAEALFERAAAAERDRQARLRDDLLARLAVYDPGQKWQARWSAPGSLTLLTAPVGAQVELGRYVADDKQRRVLTEIRPLGTTPLSTVPLPPGSYLLTLSAPGSATVRYPFVVSRGEPLKISVSLPRSQDVPPGYAYVPPGRFFFGLAEEQVPYLLLNAAPLHMTSTGGYLISKYEVTYAEWIAFLLALPPAERKLRLPSVGSNASDGSLKLTELPGGRWQLSLKPRDTEFMARDGEPLKIPARKARSVQDWMKLPVGGVSFEDVRAYADWLGKTGRLPGARPCTEMEWERAAKGADDRMYAHGDGLQPEDANFDQTYGKAPDSFGPDEVGSHPMSRSPFGVDDLVGNHYEWCFSSLARDEAVIHGGSYYQDQLSGSAANRNVLDPTFRASDTGVRICASHP